MNKSAIIIQIFLFFGFQALLKAREFEAIDNFSQSSIDSSDEIYWLTPSKTKTNRGFLLTDKLSMEMVTKIKRRLSNLSIAKNIDNFLMDPEDAPNGYLIFMKGMNVACVLKVEPRPTNKKSVRYCHWIGCEDQIIVTYQIGGMLDGLVANLEYRDLIKEISLPKRPRNNQFFKVYEWGSWSTRFDPFK
jgi:hypothetical protein